MLAWRKYNAVFRITLSNNLVYVTDFLFRSIFLVVLLYVFIQLWTTTYSASERVLIGGLTVSDMIWYLILTESIFMSTPRLNERIEEEVKGGDIGYRLNRPMSYLLYHFSSYIGEGIIRFGVNLVVGSLVGLAMLDRIPFSVVSIGAYLLLTIGAFTTNYVMSMVISLSAFWLEDTKGIQFVYSKLVLTLGGTMMPLDVFPDWIRKITMWLPFQAVAYIPAKVGVMFNNTMFWNGLLIQAGWTAALSLVLMWVYRKGVQKLHVNGG